MWRLEVRIYSIRMGYITKRVEKSPQIKRNSAEGDTAGEQKTSFPSRCTGIPLKEQTQ